MVKIVLATLFICKSDAAGNHLEGISAEDLTFSNPALEDTCHNPFFQMSVVSQLLHISSQIFTLIFQEISATFHVYTASVLTCRFYL